MWAVLTGVGFTATQFYQKQNINGVWFLISILGLGYMYKVMPLKTKLMKRIYLSWLIPITIGMTVSALVFHITSWATLIQYLGAYWLAVMAVGYFFNGLVDAPSKWYWFASALNLAAAILCYKVQPFIANQYIIAAIVSVWSMLNLWLLRTDV